MINYSGKIIVVAGPTASGKSSIAIKLANKINGYIINADSKQIYKGLVIGTAQPIPEKTDSNCWYVDGVEHYLYGYVSPEDRYSLYKYQTDVQKILDQKKDSKQTPILVGGTGLYIDSVVFNYDLKDEPQKKNREDLESLSLEELQELAKDWINDMNESDRKNPIRLIRSIERNGNILQKGKPLNHIYFVVDPEKDIVESKIVKRIDEMIDDGLVEENKEFRKLKIDINSPVSRVIGYQEFNGYFENRKSLDDIKKDIALHTVQYSKRQRTWFRRNKDAIWVTNYDQLEEKLLSSS